ncbi:hypothetical protein RHGRI_016345 [Rhododendron griersonianum]|uniref:TIR domain-containing protein n=1 Tax=Rhododendron griersonianum TaxID=479676 RepID=A0AAV6JTT6_9ERIC|nr:hypothetical protein RHGRI_016345 [Rhododendron griersonianum]
MWWWWSGSGGVVVVEVEVVVELVVVMWWWWSGGDGGGGGGGGVVVVVVVVEWWWWWWSGGSVGGSGCGGGGGVGRSGCGGGIIVECKGSDTRTKFTDHLYEALKREGFETFRDNEGIERGENIKSELQRAIWNSSMSVIVLSETYATSKSCLFEIQTILEHHKKKPDHVIFPVFYEVEPSEIKEQAKNLDFRGKKVTDEEVKGWSAALKEVASMAGMVSGNQSNGSEAKFIEEILGVLKRKQADKHLRDLDENMQNLKRKVEYLSGQKNDINSQIRDKVCWPGIRLKKEVEVWLTDVQQFKEDVQRLEQEVDGETNVSSRTRLGKVIARKILEVQELQIKGSGFDSLVIDELPTCRPLLMTLVEVLSPNQIHEVILIGFQPTSKDFDPFSECNYGFRATCLIGDISNQIRAFQLRSSSGLMDSTQVRNVSCVISRL